jgi:hypothetical protein
MQLRSRQRLLNDDGLDYDWLKFQVPAADRVASAILSTRAYAKWDKIGRSRS